jgi:hypothetical protein
MYSSTNPNLKENLAWVTKINGAYYVPSGNLSPIPTNSLA